jgi:hypothetical protein
LRGKDTLCDIAGFSGKPPVGLEVEFVLKV